MNNSRAFPRQALSYKSKTKKWREDCVRFASENTILSSSSVRKTVAHKQINYDLLNGKIHMDDIESVLNPGIDTKIKAKPIQHYPIINSKIQLLLGEERATPLDYKVVVTNPLAISQIEQDKKKQVISSIEEMLSQNLDEESQQETMEKMQKYYTYEYQDIREIRANCILNHYSKEQNFDAEFNDGFADALSINEEIYRVYDEVGEPKLKKVNPNKLRVIGLGSSNRIEDAGMLIYEDYLPLNVIIDNYYNKLSKSDIDKLEKFANRTNSSNWNNGVEDPLDYFRYGSSDFNRDEYGNIIFTDGIDASGLPYDIEGNIRVLQVYWKSLRKIKQIKRYNEIDGKPEYVFRSEDYECVKELGEEEEIYWINEAWQGVMIGAGDNAIFVNLGPCKTQYNTMTNPSKCHFGFIGTIYNINEQAPYSMIDMMKPYSYMYDVTKSRLNKLLDRNIGKAIVINPSITPNDFDPYKTMHFLKNAGMVVVDPTKEGTGIAAGKPAGAYNNIPMVIDLEMGNSIQMIIQFLSFLNQELDQITGITPQRMGQVENRETMGGIERSNLQSSHVTRWYFAKHNDTKKRVLEAFLEQAKISLRGRNKKFEYILPDHSKVLIEIDGDVFAECDYGLVVDNSYDMRALNQSIDQIAQAAMQNQAMMFSTFLKLKSNCSMADKIKMIEQDEQAMLQRNQEAQQQQLQAQQEANQAQMQAAQAKLESDMQMNSENNETKLLIKQLELQQASMTKLDEDIAKETPLDRDKLNEQIRQFNAKLDLDKERLEFEKSKHSEDNNLKLKLAKTKSNKTSK